MLHHIKMLDMSIFIDCTIYTESIYEKSDVTNDSMEFALLKSEICIEQYSSESQNVYLQYVKISLTLVLNMFWVLKY